MRNYEDRGTAYAVSASACRQCDVGGAGEAAYVAYGARFSHVATYYVRW